MFAGLYSGLSRTNLIDGSGAVPESRSPQEKIQWLEDRLDRLPLISMAMWELVRERAELSEEDLMTKVQEIDLRDGQADGKVTPQVKHCPQCDRVMSPRHQRCLYCGGSIESDTAFDKVT